MFCWILSALHLHSLSCFVFLALCKENPDSHKSVAGKGKSILLACLHNCVKTCQVFFFLRLSCNVECETIVLNFSQLLLKSIGLFCTWNGFFSITALFRPCKSWRISLYNINKLYLLILPITNFIRKASSTEGLSSSQWQIQVLKSYFCLKAETY